MTHLRYSFFGLFIFFSFIISNLADCGCRVKNLEKSVTTVDESAPEDQDDKTNLATLDNNTAGIIVPNGSVMAIPKKQGYLPKNFRTLYKSPVMESLGINTKILRASGSAQPTPLQLEHTIQTIRGLTNDATMPIYIVDLRLEPHGYYGDELIQVYDKPYWEGFNPELVEKYEEEFFENLKKLPELTLYRHIRKEERIRIAEGTEVVTDHSSRLMTEKQLCSKLGVHYVRLAVMDHSAPQPIILKKFFDFMRTLPKNAWVHFHCAAGRGRTSSFLALYDLFKRKPKGSFENFLKMHQETGSIDLFNIVLDYKEVYAQRRFNLLQTTFENRQKF